ncbi:MAG: glycosyltransferase, partial [Salinisphaera sp.]|nr:glycosyltransferase [Salinisphaera sp.]
MPLKVLVLTNLFPSAWDPQRSAFNRQQFERLAQRDRVEVEVMTAVDLRQRLAGRHGDPGLRHVHAHHFNFVYPPRIGRGLHAWFWLASLWVQRGRYLRTHSFDCLLASWAYPDGVAVAHLARHLHLPYAIKVHGSDLNVLAEVPAQRRQIGAALHGAVAVIAVSQALAEKAEALGVDPERIHVLYNGVDPERFYPGSRDAARERLGIPQSAELVLYI